MEDQNIRTENYDTVQTCRSCAYLGQILNDNNMAGYYCDLHKCELGQTIPYGKCENYVPAVNVASDFKDLFGQDSKEENNNMLVVKGQESKDFREIDRMANELCELTKKQILNAADIAYDQGKTDGKKVLEDSLNKIYFIDHVDDCVMISGIVDNDVKNKIKKFLDDNYIEWEVV